MYTLKADTVKNRLLFTFAGLCTVEEMTRMADETAMKVKLLKPGFDVITDIRTYKPASPEVAAEVERAQVYMVKGGASRGVRVVGDSAVAGMQFGRTSKRVAYPSVNLPTFIEAERWLAGGYLESTSEAHPVRSSGSSNTTSVRTKIVFLAFLGIIGVGTFFTINTYLSVTTQKSMEIDKTSRRITTDILQEKIIRDNFLATGNRELLKSREEVRQETKSAISALQTQTLGSDLFASAQKLSPLEETSAGVFASMAENLSEIKSGKERIRTKISEMHNFLQQTGKESNSEEGDTNGKDLLIASREYLALWDARLLNIQDLSLLSRAEDYLQTRRKIAGELDQKSKSFLTLLQSASSPQYSNAWDKVKAYPSQIDDIENSLFASWKKNEDLKFKLDEIGTELSKAVSQIDSTVLMRMEKNNKTGEMLTRTITLADSTALILLSFLIIRSITRTLNRSITSLSEIAGQVEMGAKQISASSQQLADGTSQQVSSIEATSSSLEEMSTMTRQNAQNANQVNKFMKEATGVVEKANSSMGLLTASMNEISEASRDIQKIINTIDEIAFQTNLLALNAAVEAARAGETGAGFAVVADEVRNLAMRAAEAARNTASLIDGTVRKVQDGSDLVQNTNEDFGRVSESVIKSGGLLEEIAAASGEQAQGIEQLNRSVAEIEGVTQQTSASAEETASASEEMSGQARQMRDFVGELIGLVGGGGKRRSMFSGLGKAFSRSGGSGKTANHPLDSF